MMEKCRCQQCDREYSPNGNVEGLCPACLLASALTQSVMTVECPQCHQPMEMADDQGEGVVCPFCSGSLRLDLEGIVAQVVDRPLTRVGRFELLKVVGTGAFGTVWQAKDMLLGRLVAVKIPRDGQFANAEAEDRFLREARIAAQLRHPGIVPVYEVERVDDRPFIVSEFVDGVTLAQWKTEHQPAFRQVAEWMAQVGEALDYSHRLGVVHRDLKPGNIMLEPSMERDGGYRARVMDFGMAKSEKGDATLTQAGHILGTAFYMSPEQIRACHTVDRRADIYSMGVVLYELLTGEVPFRGSTQVVLSQVLEAAVSPLRYHNRLIPADLETITLKCLEKDPDRRYQTAGAMAEDLRRWLCHLPITVRPTGLGGRLWRWCCREPVLSVLTAALVCALLAGFAGVLWQWRRAEALLVAANEQQRETEKAYLQLRRARAVSEGFKQEKSSAFEALVREREERNRMTGKLLKEAAARDEALRTVLTAKQEAESARKKAVTEEEKARLNEQRARLAEAKADDLEKRALQQLEKLGLVQITGAALYGQAQDLLNGGKVEEALQSIDYAIRISPNEPAFCCFKGHVLESALRFADAREAYRQALQLNPQHAEARANFDWCKNIPAPDDKDGKISAKTLCSLRELMEKEGRIMAASFLVSRASENNDRLVAELNEILFQSSGGAMLRKNRRQIRVNNGGLELDLGGLQVDRIDFLKGIPLNRLVLSDTGVGDLRPLSGMPLHELELRKIPMMTSGGMLDSGGLNPLAGLPLRKLDLSGTAVRDLSALMGMQLSRLYLSETPVETIQPLNGMPLEELRLDGCVKLKPKDLMVVLTMPRLRVLTVSCPGSQLEFLRQLPALEYLDHTPVKMRSAWEFWGDQKIR
ncbi:MAG: protein kinase [Verrucomicrobiae bacterium]|nr:protein kinase [Verrucomicrobiae bacterium]